jgi:hypothetical protein
MRLAVGVVAAVLTASCGHGDANTGGYDPGGEAGYLLCKGLPAHAFRLSDAKIGRCRNPAGAVAPAWVTKCADRTYLALLSPRDLSGNSWKWATTRTGTWHEAASPRDPSYQTALADCKR